jgi:hypothetical protein
MVVFRIVAVDSFADEPHEKVAIYSFVMMKRLQVEIVEPEDRANQKDSNHSKAPVLRQEVVNAGHVRLPRRRIRLDSMSLSVSLLTA